MGRRVYAISLTQPWASLTANALREFETRSYAPGKGRVGTRIVIHAAKKPMGKRWDGKPLSRVFWDDVQKAFGDSRWSEQLPYGKVIACATLAGAYQTGQTYSSSEGVLLAEIKQAVHGSRKLCAIRTDSFGDFHSGRWAWLLTELHPVVPQCEVDGHHGPWTWEAPDFVLGINE